MIAKDVNCAVRHCACLHCSPAKTLGDPENKEREEGTGSRVSCFKRIPFCSWSVKSLAGELTRGIAEGPSKVWLLLPGHACRQVTPRDLVCLSLPACRLKLGFSVAHAVQRTGLSGSRYKTALGNLLPNK